MRRTRRTRRVEPPPPPATAQALAHVHRLRDASTEWASPTQGRRPAADSVHRRHLDPKHASPDCADQGQSLVLQKIIQHDGDPERHRRPSRERSVGAPTGRSRQPSHPPRGDRPAALRTTLTITLTTFSPRVPSRVKVASITGAITPSTASTPVHFGKAALGASSLAEPPLKKRAKITAAAHW